MKPELVLFSATIWAVMLAYWIVKAEMRIDELEQFISDKYPDEATPGFDAPEKTDTTKGEK